MANEIEKPLYTVVLTHDVDVIALEDIPVSSRSFWGFPYRCIMQNLRRARKGDMSLVEYLGSCAWGVGCLLTKVGIVPDPYLASFHRMISIERDYGVRSTLFLMPFAGKSGHISDGSRAPSKRRAHYELEEWRDFFALLGAQGWELGCHGIDCHMSPESAKLEYQRMANMFGPRPMGLRMHWLVSNSHLMANAKAAGFMYDSTTGYNEDAGYPKEWARPFIDHRTGLPIVPLHIQDSAILGEWRLGLSRQDAISKINDIMDEAARQRGVLTVLWHTNSFGPPRYWGQVYVHIIKRALSDGARIVRACDVVSEEVDATWNA
jgi:peptidoglycan/xylan/chitin deacetylase (PgdA/CDA1 family)